MRQSAAGRRGQLDPVARIAGRVRSAFPLTRPERVPDTRPEHRNHPAGVPVNPTRGRSQYPTRTRSRYPTPTRSHSAIRPRIHSPGCHTPGRYRAWKRKASTCGLDDLPSCPRSKPTQLTPAEQTTMREMVHADEYGRS